MSIKIRLGTAAVAWCLITGFWLPAAPPSAPAPLSQLAVDVISRKSGPPLRGAVVATDYQGTLTVVVGSSWLKEQPGQTYDQQLQAYQATQSESTQDVLDRIADWLPQTSPGSRLRFFLEQEQTRLTAVTQQNEFPPPEFFWFTLPANEVTRVRPASADRQSLALWAWFEGLPQVETRSVASLKKELEARKVKLNGSPPDLADRLPARLQSDAEWAARKSIVSYTLTIPLDLQGMGSTLLPVKPDEPVDWKELLPSILDQEVSRMTSDLLELPKAPTAEDDWLPSAIRLAEEHKVIGFRVTRLVTRDPKVVQVHSHFVARMPQNQWQKVWSDIQSARSDIRQPDQEAQLANDPQVQAILKVVTAISPDAQTQLQTALQTGVATQSALTASNAAFFRFRDRYVQHLDRPYLPCEEK